MPSNVERRSEAVLQAIVHLATQLDVFVQVRQVRRPLVVFVALLLRFIPFLLLSDSLLPRLLQFKNFLLFLVHVLF